ncbi:MAG: PQQ-binding-like beta-propeller repeat protein [Acidobacteriota bacterium]
MIRWFSLVGCFLLAVAPLVASTPEELHDAAREGDMATVKAAIEAGVPVDAPTRYGATALTFAAEKGHAEVVAYLLEKGADPNVRDTFYGQQPLGWAQGSDEVVRLLLAAGAEGEIAVLRQVIPLGKTALIDAALGDGRLYTWDREIAATIARNSKNEELAERIEALEPRPLPPTLKLEPAELERFVGAYVAGDGETKLDVSVQDGVLVAESPTLGEKHRLEPLIENQFRSADDPMVGLAFFGRSGTIEAVIAEKGLLQAVFRPDEEGADDEEAAASETTTTAATPRAAAAPWAQFRGHRASGVADGQGPPATWDPESGENVRWKVEVAGLGHASPIVWGDRVYLITAISSAADGTMKTGAYGDVETVGDLSTHVWKLLALDAATGDVVWERVAGETEPLTDRHTKATQANSSPVTDGEHIVAVFPTIGLFCWSKDGELLWKRDLGALNAGWFYDASYEWGFAASPILHDGKVILQADVHEGAHIAAFDLATGETVWRTERENEIPTWATPTVYDHDGRDALVVNGTVIRGYDVATGDELWSLAPNSEVIIATPIVKEVDGKDELLYVSAGYPPARMIYAVRPGASGDISLADGERANDGVAWSWNKGGAYMPTPILYQGLFIIGHHNGRLQAYDPATGESVFRARFSKGGTFTASPVAADGKLYFGTEEGDVYVLRAGRAYDEIAVIDMGEPVFATPAISDGTLYVRTTKHLWALGETSK